MGVLSKVGINLPNNVSRMMTDAVIIFGLLELTDRFNFIGNIISDSNPVKGNIKLTALLLTAPLIANFAESKHLNL